MRRGWKSAPQIAHAHRVIVELGLWACELLHALHACSALEATSINTVRMQYTILALCIMAARCFVQATQEDHADILAQSLSPALGAKNVNPDSHLLLTFAEPPSIGTSGRIQVFDQASSQIVDTLDLSIPSSPGPSGRVAPGGKVPKYQDPNDKTVYQVNTIAGFPFHFFPIIVRGNTARITLHNGVLQYGKTYGVRIDHGVLRIGNASFAEYSTSNTWTFSTKTGPPTSDTSRLVVSADGSGDFNTVQGAVDFLPEKSSKRRTIFIKNGDYEEIVFVRSKSDLTIRGESRDNVKVGYPNNSVFNPNPAGSGPSRRVAFTVYKSNDVQLSTFTISNYFTGQAEALLVNGDRVIVDRMTLKGSGDAFTTYGTIYFVDSSLYGDGDTVLGYAAVYFLRSEIQSLGPITWTRTPAGSHGNIFVNSTIIGVDKPLPWTTTADGRGGTKASTVFARLPRNEGSTTGKTNFPDAEMVLINVKTKGISPVGWGPIEAAGPGFNPSNLHLWEYNTMDLDGKPADMSQRHPVSKQLTMEKDAITIADYRRPEFVLKGWSPVLDQA